MIPRAFPPTPREPWFRAAPAALTLALALGACSGEGASPGTAAPSPATNDAAPASSADRVASDAEAAASAANPAANPAADPVADPVDGAAAAEPGAAGERYSGGLKTLDTGYDLSALREEPATPAATEGHDHDDHAGHDHGEQELVAQPSADTQPGGLSSAATRFLGGISLAPGESKVWDFGMIREGEAREKTFKFVSDGEEPLVIKAVKPSCGCTKADIMLNNADGERVAYEKGSEIAPGTPFELDTAISTEGKHGAFGTSVSIYTNAPGGSFNLKLEAAVEPVLEVLPQQTIFLGQMTTADMRTEVLTVKATRGELFHLSTKDETLPEELAVVLTPEEPDAEGRSASWKVEISAGPGLPVGVRNYPCALVSSLEVPGAAPMPDGSPKVYTVPVAVQARVTGMVHATPAFVGFGLVRPGQEVERSVRLECFDEHELTADIPITLAGLYGGEFEHRDRFEVTLEPLEGGKLLDVHVKLLGLPEGATGSFGGVLQIAVGHPTMDELAVRFSGVCRAGSPRAGG